MCPPYCCPTQLPTCVSVRTAHSCWSPQPGGWPALCEAAPPHPPLCHRRPGARETRPGVSRCRSGIAYGCRGVCRGLSASVGGAFAMHAMLRCEDRWPLLPARRRTAQRTAVHLMRRQVGHVLAVQVLTHLQVCAGGVQQASDGLQGKGATGGRARQGKVMLRGWDSTDPLALQSAPRLQVAPA